MRNEVIKDNVFRAIIVILTSTLYSLAVIWFLEPANLISIGLTGTGQILNRLFAFGNINIPVGVFTFVLNIPLCIYGARRVSKKFILFTLLSVLVQSFWMLDWEWVKVDFGLNPERDTLLMAVIAGLLSGISTGVALRYGTSTGGIDIIAQALSLKKHISIGMFSTILNFTLAIIAGGIMQGNWSVTLYTIIFIVVSYIAVDKIHTAYNYIRIDIITKNATDVSTALMQGITRGCTISEVTGAYTSEKKYVVFMIISSYELHKAKRIVEEIDPNAFMTVTPIKRLFGKFFKKTII